MAKAGFLLSKSLSKHRRMTSRKNTWVILTRLGTTNVGHFYFRMHSGFLSVKLWKRLFICPSAQCSFWNFGKTWCPGWILTLRWCKERQRVHFIKFWSLHAFRALPRKTFNGSELILNLREEEMSGMNLVFLAMLRNDERTFLRILVIARIQSASQENFEKMLF